MAYKCTEHLILTKNILRCILKNMLYFEHESTDFNFLKLCLTKTTTAQCHDF